MPTLAQTEFQIPQLKAPPLPIYHLMGMGSQPMGIGSRIAKVAIDDNGVDVFWGAFIGNTHEAETLESQLHDLFGSRFVGINNIEAPEGFHGNIEEALDWQRQWMAAIGDMMDAFTRNAVYQAPSGLFIFGPPTGGHGIVSRAMAQGVGTLTLPHNTWGLHMMPQDPDRRSPLGQHPCYIKDIYKLGKLRGVIVGDNASPLVLTHGPDRNGWEWQDKLLANALVGLMIAQLQFPGEHARSFGDVLTRLTEHRTEGLYMVSGAFWTDRLVDVDQWIDDPKPKGWWDNVKGALGFGREEIIPVLQPEFHLADTLAKIKRALIKVRTDPTCRSVELDERGISDRYNLYAVISLPVSLDQEGFWAAIRQGINEFVRKPHADRTMRDELSEHPDLHFGNVNLVFTSMNGAPLPQVEVPYRVQVSLLYPVEGETPKPHKDAVDDHNAWRELHREVRGA